MNFDDNIIELYKKLMSAEIIISPWLAGVDINDRFDPGVFEILNVWAGEFALTQWTEDVQISVFGAIPIPGGFLARALYEAASSTAVLEAHEHTGTLYVGEKTARKAIEKLEYFINSQGLGAFLQLYRLINLYESMNALDYYGKIPQKQYLLGKWHRPWIDYSLDDELVINVMEGIYSISLADNHRYISLSETGITCFEQIKKLLEEAGFFKDRLNQLRISQFNLYKDYEQVALEVWPEAVNTRNDFLNWAGIRPGMKVLELGCGSGPFTFEGGLAARVGPQGSVVGLDPSKGMINRAKCKQQTRSLPWVTFLEGRAEELPFPDNFFDAVLGVAFLHFTERDRALAEMRRVTRPGGIVASCHPLRFTFDKPFFREWFAPLLIKSSSHNHGPKNYLPFTDEVPDCFSRAGITLLNTKIVPFPSVFHDSHKIIQHFIFGVGLFQEEMADLPYKARQELIEDLKMRGEEVCRKYPEQERVVDTTNQMVKGIVL